MGEKMMALYWLTSDCFGAQGIKTAEPLKAAVDESHECNPWMKQGKQAAKPLQVPPCTGPQHSAPSILAMPSSLLCSCCMRSLLNRGTGIQFLTH